MEISIKSGQTGNIANVTEENRLSTDSVGVDEFKDQIRKGFGFVITNETATLTSDNESGIIYFRNDSQVDVVLESFSVNLGTSTGGTGDTTVLLYTNVTDGTLLTDADPGRAFNLNIGSANRLNGEVFQGNEGSTIVGSVEAARFLTSNVTLSTFDLFSVRIPQGSSIALSVIPPSGNTSMFAIASGQIYYVGESI